MWLGSTHGVKTSGPLRCDAYGEHELHWPEFNKGARQRPVQTTKQGCKFLLYAYQCRWDLGVLHPCPFYFRVRYALHNHPRRPLQCLGPQRRATGPIKVVIENFLRWRALTAIILNALNDTFPGHNILHRQVNMVRESIKRRTYLGFSSAQMLKAKLQTESIPHHIWMDQHNNMTAMLCVNPDAVRLFQRMNSVLFMDCTY